MIRRFGFAPIGLAALVAAAGCQTSSDVTPYESALRQAQSCDDVLAAIQQDAAAKVDLELESFINQDYYARPGGVLFMEDAAVGAGGAGGVPAAPQEGSDSNGADAPSGFSDTNRQVADVDEADIVKVGDEGRKLYVIRGNGFYEFNSWPPAETSKLADLEIEGNAMEMF
ncbi:MAG: beta-propeller domain-containing protein, partial [Myxococcales bacterium]